MKKTRWLFLIFCFVPTPSWAEILISEGSLQKRIENSNDLIQAGEHQVQAFAGYRGELGRSFLPSATVFAAQENFTYANQDLAQPYYGVKVEMNLYNGGRDRVKNDLAKSSHLQEQSKLKILKFKKLEEARKSMWRALYLKELIRQYEEAQSLIDKNRKQALRRIKGGVATKSDQYEFEIKSSELKQDIEKSKLGLAKEKGLLKILLGISSQESIRLIEPLEHDHQWRKLFAHSESDHDYLLKPQEFEIKKSSLKSELGGKEWLPQLGAYASWQQFNRRQDFDRLLDDQRQLTNLGIQLKWSFSRFIDGRVKRSAEQARAQANNLKLNYQKRELENELHLELRELDLLDGMVHVAEKNIDRSQKFFNLITQEYKRGVKTSGDMLAATEKLVASKVRKMMIVRDFHIARAHVMSKLGK